MKEKFGRQGFNLWVSAQVLSNSPSRVSKKEGIQLCRCSHCSSPPSALPLLQPLRAGTLPAQETQGRYGWAVLRIRPSLFQEFSKRTNAHTEKEHAEITACSAASSRSSSLPASVGFLARPRR